jgi:ribose 5-phosphate isomerase B
MKVVVGSDHAAFTAKELVKEFLRSKNIDVVDMGTMSEDRCDYPDYAIQLCREVLHQHVTGILLCGSGIGVSMVANRFSQIRAALCRTPLDAELARKHNDANVICLGARISTEAEIKLILESWFLHQFEGGRHIDRIKKFQNIGEKLNGTLGDMT